MQIPLNSKNPVDILAVEQIRNEISHLFEAFDTSYDNPQKGTFRLRGRVYYDFNDPAGFDEIIQIFEKYGFTPFIRPDNHQAALFGYPIIFEQPKPNWALHIGLFIATILATLSIGIFHEPALAELLNASIENENFREVYLANVWKGWPYCLAIMSILLAHELGHYFAALKHKLPATPPFFIPLPFSDFGTLGALILQRGPSKNIRAQFDFGASGPLAGLLFAVPVVIFGLMTSEVTDLPPNGGYTLEGNSIFYLLTKAAIFGEFLPTDSYDVYINQLAFAGWTGLFITGLNLLPVSPFDGGRVLQVLVGENTLRQLFWPILVTLAAVGIITATPTLFVWCAMLYFFGNRYERPMDELMQLDPRRRAIAIFTVIIFILVFTPIPVTNVPLVTP